jgi:hypothetical protein
VIQAPATGGERLVHEQALRRSLSGDQEIRLTYRELTALIEDAIKALR